MFGEHIPDRHEEVQRALYTSGAPGKEKTNRDSSGISKATTCPAKRACRRLSRQKYAVYWFWETRGENLLRQLHVLFAFIFF